MNKDKIIEEAVLTAPLSLLVLSEKDIAKANLYLPYSVGIEIECPWKEEKKIVDGQNDGTEVTNPYIHSYIDSFKKSSSFRDIPNIMDVSCDMNEKRFRIPNGVKGLICLYLISEQLAMKCELNPLSGIHYHIDMTHSFDEVSDNVSQVEAEFILSELEREWIPGDYNSRTIGTSHNWIRKQSSFKTFEFRIGEMTFDYSLLLKRIRHASSLVSYLNINRGISDPLISTKINNKTEILDFYKSMSYTSDEQLKISKLENRLKELRRQELGENVSEEEKKDILSKRTIKISL